jgi:hypothetical protein
LISWSSSSHDSLKSWPLIIRRAISNLFSLCKGLLHRSMVLERAFDASSHHVSHQSHSCAK